MVFSRSANLYVRHQWRELRPLGEQRRFQSNFNPPGILYAAHQPNGLGKSLHPSGIFWFVETESNVQATVSRCLLVSDCKRSLLWRFNQNRWNVRQMVGWFEQRWAFSWRIWSRSNTRYVRLPSTHLTNFRFFYEIYIICLNSSIDICHKLDWKQFGWNSSWNMCDRCKKLSSGDTITVHRVPWWILSFAIDPTSSQRYDRIMIRRHTPSILHWIKLDLTMRVADADFYATIAQWRQHNKDGCSCIQVDSLISTRDCERYVERDILWSHSLIHKSVLYSVDVKYVRHILNVRTSHNKWNKNSDCTNWTTRLNYKQMNKINWKKNYIS